VISIAHWSPLPHGPLVSWLGVVHFHPLVFLLLDR
jgi:hypothetical protein